MDYLSLGFWEFEHSCKYDQLIEPNHTHLVHAALRDKETNLEYNRDGTYTLYGKQEALLVIPQFLSTQLLLFFGCRIKALNC